MHHPCFLALKTKYYFFLNREKHSKRNETEKKGVKWKQFIGSRYIFIEVNTSSDKKAKQGE